MSSVDVVIPCYRYGRYLRECVQSVLAQDVPVRILIIDDASPDDTPQVASQLTVDARVQYVRHAVNRGHIATYNEGLEWATSEYLLLLSADDYLLPGALGRAVALLDQHKTASFAFGNCVTLVSDGAVRSVRSAASLTEGPSTRLISGEEFISLSGARNIVPTPTAVVRTTMQHRVGGYRSELPHTGDMEMWLRLAAHGAVGFIEAEQAVYRQHSGNMSKVFYADHLKKDLAQRRLAIDCFLGIGCPDPVRRTEQRRHLLRSLAIAGIEAASGAYDAGDAATAYELASFARKQSSAVVWTLPWWKFQIRRVVGPSLSKRIRLFAGWAGLCAARPD